MTAAKRSPEIQGALHCMTLFGRKVRAFTEDERRQLGLEGLLPHAVETLDRQVGRVLEHLDVKSTHAVASPCSTSAGYWSPLAPTSRTPRTRTRSSHRRISLKPSKG
jgi:hypothetical protein